MELQPISSVVPGPSLPPTPGDESIRTFCITEPNGERDGAAIMASSSNGVEHDSVVNGKQRRRAKIQLAGIYGAMFLAGWNDGSSGPMIPRIQKVYDIGFVLVSMTFVCACVGFIGGALINMHWADRFGFGKMVVLAIACQAVAFAIQASAPPYPLFAIAFAVNGIGNAIQNAQGNAYVASLKKDSETYMGLLHASYGAGAFTAPLVATQFSQMPRWSFHYLVSMGIAVANLASLVLVFRFRSLEDCLARVGESAGEKSTSDHSNFRQILSLKSVHLLSIFALIYVGVEVTIGGWIITYIIDVRHGGPSAGYISSGFFGGLMMGRLTLLWVNKVVGENRVLYLYAFLAIGLELIVWFVPSLIGGAVAVSLVGMFLGPIYPIIMNRAARAVPRWLLSPSIGWIAGFGQTGSAALPFLTGAVASKAGIRSLQPLLISMMAMFPVIWAMVPISRRID